MKSFVAYPSEMENILYPQPNEHRFSGKLIAHYELYKKILEKEGAIVKCGISDKSGFMRFASLRNLLANSSNKMVAFEKQNTRLFIDNEDNREISLLYKVNNSSVDEAGIKKILSTQGISQQVDFIPGNLDDSIPQYLMDNPDTKISFLNIDLDDYEASLTALQFFYPRLIEGGVLIMDNYYKREDDFHAYQDFFQFIPVDLRHFSINKGPHYFFRK